MPQAEPSATAPSRRNGLRVLSTRRWSTPPAPSTSSAAAATAPSSTTSGRAPTEVRGPDSVGGRSRGCTGLVLQGVLRGYYGGTKGYYMGTYRLPRGCLGGSKRVLRGYSGVLGSRRTHSHSHSKRTRVRARTHTHTHTHACVSACARAYTHVETCCPYRGREPSVVVPSFKLLPQKNVHTHTQHTRTHA